MQINDCKLWIEDIDKIIQSLPEISALHGKTVMVTGATGLVCSSVVDILNRYNETHQHAIKIVVAGRSSEKVNQRFGRFCHDKNFLFIKYDAINSMGNTLNLSVDYIIHGASNAYPAIIAAEPVETMLDNMLGVKELLDYSVAQKVKRLLFVSSSEIYGQKESNTPYRENEYGYIDLLNPRSSYSVSKRAAETLCISYAAEYNVDSVIVRPGHIYGPTASPADNRVSSMWAFSAARGEDIIMKSEGRQLRSYCYCLDCASAILKVLLKGEKKEAYNISTPAMFLSILQIAELYARAGGVKVKFDIPTKQEKAAFNPMENSCLDGEKLKRLGWENTFSPEIATDHTIKILQECM